MHCCWFVVRVSIHVYSSTSKLRMGQVQNNRLYIRNRSSSKKNEAEERKKLTDYFPLLFSIKYWSPFDIRPKGSTQVYTVYFCLKTTKATRSFCNYSRQAILTTVFFDVTTRLGYLYKRLTFQPASLHRSHRVNAVYNIQSCTIFKRSTLT